MMKNLATTFVVLVMATASLFADAKNGGIAREIAMGGSQSGSGLILNPFVMDDPALLLLNPAYQAMYKDYAWMNIGGGTVNGLSTANNGYGQQNAGVAFGLGRSWSFGAILSYDPSAVNGVSSLLRGVLGVPSIVRRTGEGGGGQVIPAVANMWEVVAAYEMGGAKFGFGFSYGHSNRDSTISVPAPGTSVSTEASAHVFGFRLGMNLDLGSGSALDASAALRLDKATDNIDLTPAPTGGTDDGDYSATGTEFQFQARGKFKMSNKVNFVPYGLIAILSAEPKEDKAPAALAAVPIGSEKLTALAYAVGVGGEYKTPSFYLSGGISVQSARAKVELNEPTLPAPAPPPGSSTTTVTYFALPVFNVGGEWWFTDWLAGRGGYYRSLGNVKFETEGSTGSTPLPSTEGNLTIPNSLLFIGGITPTTNDGLITLGLGFRFGGFALDATVSEEALRRGLGLIGSQDNINTFGYLTSSFNFE